MTIENTDIVYKKKILLERLFAKLRLGIKPGLERTLKLAEFAGNPQEKFASIHIAGTNGKGSTASYLASIFSEAGFKTGLYTSPHILQFNERCKINGKIWSDEEIVYYAEQLLEYAESIDCTFFEITTVMAFKWFADMSADICIIETGMGGRYDSTNIINPIATAITSIGMDHTEFLGDTLQKIAWEKAGIIKKGTTCVLGEGVGEQAKYISRIASEIDAQIYVSYENLKIENIEYCSDFSIICTFQSKQAKYIIRSPLPGEHQVQNLATSLTIAEVVSAHFPITVENITKGIKNVKKNTGIIGRIQLLNKSPLHILDVSHNEQALERLAQSLKLHLGTTPQFNLIFAAMSDKDIRAMLYVCKQFTSKLFLPALTIPRAAINTKIAEIASEIGFNEVECFSNVTDAFSTSKFDNTIITGSFYLAGEFLENCGNELS